MDHAKPKTSVRLHRGRARPFWHGNPIVLSGAVAEVRGEQPTIGDLVEVHDWEDRLIGWGFFHPHSQYRVRLVAWASEADLRFDVASILTMRLGRAVGLRRAMGLPAPDTTAWRLFNSEGDGLSGLTVDVYANVAVVMASAAWVERHMALVDDAVRQVLPAGVRILHRISPIVMAEEGLGSGQSEECAPGRFSAMERLEVLEGGLKFLVSPVGGQKTGFYLDQRENRALVRRLVAMGRGGCAGAMVRVLDTFCYTGGFALNAALGGAAEVLAVDSSKVAIEIGRENARLNGMEDRVRFEVADALRVLENSPRAWDVVICDPPRLARSVRHLEAALPMYRRLNRAAIAAVAPGGLLVTCCCSSVVRRDLFVEVLRDAAVEAGRRLTLTHILGAAPDHPFHPAFPEGEYLKCVVGTVW